MASHPSLGKGSDSSPSPRLSPSDSVQQLSMPGGAWRPPITNRSSQAAGRSTPTPAFYPPQTNTFLSFQAGLSFPSLFLHCPTLQLHKIHFLFYSVLFFSPEVRRKKMKEVTGPIFPPLFYSLSPLVFLLSHCCPAPACVCVGVSVCVCFSPMVERQPKCERDGCQSPFLSPKVPCLSSLLCRARLHLHIVIYCPCSASRLPLTGLGHTGQIERDCGLLFIRVTAEQGAGSMGHKGAESRYVGSLFLLHFFFSLTPVLSLSFSPSFCVSLFDAIRWLWKHFAGNEYSVSHQSISAFPCRSSYW